MKNQHENRYHVKQLEAVKRAFTQWRSSRQSIREPIPKRLMDQAAKLCSIYKTARIALALHLEFNNLKQYCQEYNGQSKSKKQQTDFIELNLRQTIGTSNEHNCQITVESGNGRKINIKLENPTASILAETLKAIL